MKIYGLFLGISGAGLRCVGINTATLQSPRILEAGGRAQVALVGGGGSQSQLPVARAQYRRVAAPGREVQVSWTLPGWPHFGLKESLFEGGEGAWSGAWLGGFQYSQVDKGTLPSGRVNRQHRFDLTAALPLSYQPAHGGPFLQWPLAPYASPGIITRVQWGGGAGLVVVPSANVGLEVGGAVGVSLEGGLWFLRGFNWQVGLASHF